VSSGTESVERLKVWKILEGLENSSYLFAYLVIWVGHTASPMDCEEKH